MRKASLSLLLLITAIAASANAHAQTALCGRTLYASVALTADMVCPAGVDGLVIGAPNVRIDLNGYEITSPPGGVTTGIRSSGFDGVGIFGPGRIKSFFTSVMIAGGNHHEIREIDSLSWGHGILLRNTSRSVVEKSRVGSVELASDPGYRAAGNRIAGNDADSIHVWGCQTYKNEIANNDIHPLNQFMAVSLAHGAADNQVIANRIVSGTIWLGGVSNNLVFNNHIDNTVPSWIYAGVIMAEFPSSCANWAVVTAIGNVVQGNAIAGREVGVLMATGSHYNQVVGNKIYDQLTAGILFRVDSDNNDARNNGYGNVPVEVVDQGQRNLWP